ncbi:hypothetical protein F2P81_023660 [Scophthalmus maximus]|uniref:Uncharacterized protein n=1 Tax=Scophthalmus maximus TaxID=52904 RepID=A0A6A4RY44_SCOMX|nr:hypothetical protein F2P81_023660 [Scophthalmus maximus]
MSCHSGLTATRVIKNITFNDPNVARSYTNIRVYESPGSNVNLVTLPRKNDFNLIQDPTCSRSGVEVDPVNKGSTRPPPQSYTSAIDF